MVRIKKRSLMIGGGARNLYPILRRKEKKKMAPLFTPTKKIVNIYLHYDIILSKTSKYKMEELPKVKMS